MMRLLALGLSGSLLVAPIVAAEAQAPQRDVRTVAPQPTGTAAIGGAVVSADTAPVPIRLAHVVLIGTVTGTLRVTSTDREGRFQFANLPADRYQVGASKLPYVGAVAGARRPARPGTPVIVAEGQKVGDVTIRLPRGAVITGVITDERGQPAASAAVGLQVRRFQNGERVLAQGPGGTVITDDRGQYRIHGLPPGEYVVSAMPLSFAAIAGTRTLTAAEVDAALKGPLPPPSPAAAPATPVRFTPVFYPGTTRAGDAVPVVLGAGDERQNVDFRLELATTARLEGSVVTSDGQPASGAMVTYQTVEFTSPLQTGGSTRALPDGRFTIPNVGPGSYSVIARDTPPNSPGSPTFQFGIASVEVSGVDVTSLQLTLRPPLSLAGQLAFEGTATPPPAAGHRVPLRGLNPSVTGPMAQATATSATGAFSFTNLFPGRYVIGGPLFFGASTASVTWALQSVVADGKDVTDLPVDITPDTLPKLVVVTFSDRWQELSGRLTDGAGSPVSDYVIVVFPADKAYWVPNSRRIVTARPGSDGAFKVGGPGPVSLPPGEYLLAAVADLARDEQYDPALLESLTAAAVKTTLGAGERKVQNLIVK